MKKLMSIALGLSLILGSAAVSFAATQDDAPKKKGKKGGKKKGEEEKKSNVR